MKEFTLNSADKYKDGSPMTMWNLIENKQMPPTRLARYCCAKLKETSTPNRFIALGVRKAESTGRKGRDVFATRGKTKYEAYYYYYSTTTESVLWKPGAATAELMCHN
mgnify:CR=1 FL=1